MAKWRRTINDLQVFTPDFIGFRVTRSIVLCVCYLGRCLSFCTFSFRYCVVSRHTDSDNHLGSFKLFCLQSNTQKAYDLRTRKNQMLRKSHNSCCSINATRHETVKKQLDVGIQHDFHIRLISCWTSTLSCCFFNLHFGELWC